MKIRTDFVTNSSSSSFVCEICGRTESGFDIGPEDVDMMQCVNEHTFCCEEALEKPTKEEMIKIILEEAIEFWDSDIHKSRLYTENELIEMSEDELWDTWCDEYSVPECLCPICQFIEYSEHDLSAYLLKEYGIPREEVFAGVKKLNKRRRKLYENEYITYVCQKHNLNPAEIVTGWKEKFKTYNAFAEWLKED